MGHCYHHALSSVRKWGGVAEDYLPLHQWFDESKAIAAASAGSIDQAPVARPPSDVTAA